MLRFLLIAVVAAFLAWGGYWFAGSRAVERGVVAWIAETPAATVEAVRVRGFPNRFDVTFTAPTYTQAGFGWHAPFAQLFSLSYRPNHVIAVFPHDQSVTVNGSVWAVHSADMRASLVTRARSDLALERANLVADALRAQGMAGESLQADTLRLASRVSDDDPLSHHLGAEILGLRPDPALRGLLDPAGLLPNVIDRLYLDAQLGFDRPIDRNTLGQARVTRIDLRHLSADWGTLEIAADGTLEADAAGLMSGEIAARVRNWSVLVEAARSAGLWEPGVQPLIDALLDGLAREDGDPATITLPLSVRRGVVHIGPFPLGELPAL